MARTSISLPDDLVARLEPLKGQINISQVCQIALEAKAQTHEQIQTALSEGDVMKGLIQRLRIQRDAANHASYSCGQKDGQQWAIREATYQELERWGRYGVRYRYPRNALEEVSGTEAMDLFITDEDGNPLVEDLFPGGIAEDFLEATSQFLQESNQVFETKAYQMGFLDAVREIWSQVKDELEAEWNSPWDPDAHGVTLGDNPSEGQTYSEEV